MKNDNNIHRPITFTSTTSRSNIISRHRQLLPYYYYRFLPFLLPTRVASSSSSSSSKNTITTARSATAAFFVSLLLRSPLSSSCAWLSSSQYHQQQRRRPFDCFHHSSTVIGRRTLFSSSTATTGTTTTTRRYYTTTSISTSSDNDNNNNMNNNNNNNKYKFVDIGANLLAEQFTEGKYFGKVRHQPDWDEVLQRAIDNSVTHIILTAGTLKESKDAIHLVRKLRQQNSTLTFGCTVGIHPTRCQQEFLDRSNKEDPDELSPKDVLEELKQIAIDGITDQCVVAIGEIGLDYDRLEFCSKEIQQEYFEKQLTTFHSVNELQKLPLFLHNRNVGNDLLEVLKKTKTTTNDGSIVLQGVVHSFDDTLELATSFIDLGFYIGLNGCSLKTKENLDVVKELPLNKILLETDCPYCEIKRTHASYEYVQTDFSPNKKVEKKFELGKMVKGRNEPCQLIQVAEVIAGVKGISLDEVANQCYENSMKLYSSF